ncbi:uncharacterized protein [Cicer arietinum]|uniref:Uncharacterized protein LOC101489633 n=1 Tax=Cicer arietinum TaxID=3827 RepID=A0A1S2Y696_CICAR|nr:uncharacterized protein LOC101489633 [Cicer arietinum]
MKCTLSSKKKIQFINGLLIQPSYSYLDHDLWDRTNNMVISWITRTLSHVSQSIIFIDSAFDLWSDLCDRFTKDNHFCLFDLLRDLHSIKQGDCNLSTFFINLKILWDELEDLRPTPSCTCYVPCTCKLTIVVRSFKDQEYVTCFLKGLNDNYSNIRTKILLMENLPSIIKVYSLVAQQEPTSNPSPPNSDVVSVNYGTTNYRNTQQVGRGRVRPQPKSQMFCTHCHKTNHTVDSCYFEHGFSLGNHLNKNHNHNSLPPFEIKSTSPSNSILEDHSPSISREDYHYLVNLLQSSKKETHNKKT